MSTQGDGLICRKWGNIAGDRIEVDRRFAFGYMPRGVTITMWITSVWAGVQYLLSTFDTGFTGFGMLTSGQGVFVYSNSGSNPPAQSGVNLGVDPITFRGEPWDRLAVVLRTGTNNNQIFINGVNRTASTRVYNIPNDIGRGMWVGEKRGAGTQGYAGKMRDIKIFPVPMGLEETEYHLWGGEARCPHIHLPLDGAGPFVRDCGSSGFHGYARGGLVTPHNSRAPTSARQPVMNMGIFGDVTPPAAGRRHRMMI